MPKKTSQNVNTAQERIYSLQQTPRYIDHAFFGILDEGIIVTDENKTVKQINRATTRLLGLDSEELLGQKWPDYLDIRYRDGTKVPSTHVPINLSLSKGVRESTEIFNLVRKDGSSFPAKITTSPIKNAGGEITGVAIVFADLTKELEFEKAKTEFVSLASHQLKGPLTGIKWFLEILTKQENKNLSRKQMEYLYEINRMNMSLIEMINSLLNITRVESGKIMINPESTNLRSLLIETIKDQEQKLLVKKINLKSEIQDNIPNVEIDPRMLRHVFTNLISNSIKYSNTNGQIEVKQFIQNGSIVTSVSDNGIGVPKNQKHKVFEKFFRASNAASKETDGTGLGLYLAKAIVESSRGRIWFESDENVGTTFWFSIPLEGVPKKEGQMSL